MFIIYLIITTHFPFSDQRVFLAPGGDLTTYGDKLSLKLLGLLLTMSLLFESFLLLGVFFGFLEPFKNHPVLRDSLLEVDLLTVLLYDSPIRLLHFCQLPLPEVRPGDRAGFHLRGRLSNGSRYSLS